MTVIDHSTDQTGEFAPHRAVNGMPKAGLIYAIIPKVMAEVGAIGKGKRNEQQGYMFRGIDDVYLALQGPLATHGLFYVPRVMSEKREERTTQRGGVLIYTTLRVRFTLYAPDGSNVSGIVSGEAMDSGDKSTNKAMSAALKYFLLQTFCIPTEEAKDSEHDSPQPAPRQQQRAAPPPPQRQAAKPAPPLAKGAEPAGDDLSDDPKFWGVFADACRRRGAGDAAIDGLVVGICNKRKIRSIADLDLTSRHELIVKVEEGEMDSVLAKAAKALKRAAPAAA